MFKRNFIECRDSKKGLFFYCSKRDVLSVDLLYSNSRLYNNSEVSDMNICEKFGKNVCKYRKQQGISQERLAELANLHRTYISAVERGERSISLKNIEKIALALNISEKELFDFGGIENE